MKKYFPIGKQFWLPEITGLCSKAQPIDIQLGSSSPFNFGFCKLYSSFYKNTATLVELSVGYFIKRVKLLIKINLSQSLPQSL